jgi:hypothetical protein
LIGFSQKTFLKESFPNLSKNFILVNFYVFVICKVLNCFTGLNLWQNPPGSQEPGWPGQKRDILSKSPVFETPNRPAGEGITLTYK